MTLFDLNEGDKAVIAKVKGYGAFRKRITEMGFIPGKEIRVVKKAPLKDPVEYNILGYNVSLRNSEDLLIEVVTITEAKEMRYGISPDNRLIPDDSLLLSSAGIKGKTIHVALVGNPNSGKTTLFNLASHSKERVGNYSGVTVDAKEAQFKVGEYTIKMIDLPGTYSLSAYSPEELFVRSYIAENVPDVVLNIVDSSNLERNLYLTTQLIDMDIRLVISLNMYDELQQSGSTLDHDRLGKLLGVPIIPTISTKSMGINRLLAKIIEVYEGKDPTVRHIHINYGRHIEDAIVRIREKVMLEGNYNLTDKLSPRFIAIKLLEKDMETRSKIQYCPNKQDILDVTENEVNKIEIELGEDTESLITDAKYGFIGGALKETLQPSIEVKVKKSEIIDIFFTHKLWGIPAFLFFMWFSFYITFKIGEYPKHLIEFTVSWVSGMVQTHMPAGLLKDLIVQGVIGGVGGVIVFLPNILLLFFFISLMEDTGYLARAVFIMDKAMHRIGLHGKSFIPLLMGFGCNVPAIMSTRIIESRRDRMVTMLINPFMSCSARLPVYILFISAFFVNYQGTLLFMIYLFGILLAVLSAILFNKTIFRKADVPFVMELPPYRVPTARSLIKHMWNRAGQYLKKIGGVILLASILIWALGYFPRNPEISAQYQQKRDLVLREHKQSLKSPANASNPPEIVRASFIDKKIIELKNEEQKILQEKSFMGYIGRFVEPVMRPLGFDWKMTVAIITGIAGKEVVVSTLGVIHQAGTGTDESSSSLIQKLRDQRYEYGPKKGQAVYNQVVALSFIFFILIYFPCIAVVATIRKESGHWKWAAFVIFYTCAIAWIVAFATFQIGSLFIS